MRKLVLSLSISTPLKKSIQISKTRRFSAKSYLRLWKIRRVLALKRHFQRQLLQSKQNQHQTTSKLNVTDSEKTENTSLGKREWGLSSLTKRDFKFSISYKKLKPMNEVTTIVNNFRGDKVDPANKFTQEIQDFENFSQFNLCKLAI